MSKILVTGGAGFIGSHLVDALMTSGHETLVVDDLSGGFRDNVHEDVEFVCIDISNYDLINEEIKRFKPQYIAHLACHPHEGLSQFCPRDIVRTTINASINVFESAINNDVEKILYFSSMARYGHGKYKFPFTEDLIPEPADIYGASKLASEISLKALNEATGIKYTILVPHNISGKRMNLQDPYRGVLAIWINSLARGKPFYIYGNGEQRRAFSNVRDIIPCCVRAIFDEKVNGETINIGSAISYSLKETADMVIRQYARKRGVSIGKLPKPIYVEDRPCEVKNAYSTVEKSKELLDFKDACTLEKTINEIIDYVIDCGPKEPVYFDNLEITKNAPRVWVERKI